MAVFEGKTKTFSTVIDTMYLTHSDVASLQSLLPAGHSM